MENNFAHQENTEDNMQVALAECWPGGPIVSNPADCRGTERDTWRNRSTPEGFPELQLTGLDDTSSSNNA